MLSSLSFLLLFFSSLHRSPCLIQALTCIDDNNAPVDWFVAIKPPEEAQKHVGSLDKYLLFTSSAKEWRESAHDVNDNGGAIYDTINQVYNVKDKNNTLIFMYNDEVPKTSWSSSTYGHMKGVLGFESDSKGFWIINSVPKFPGHSTFSYPHSGLRYGQHFICVTFDADKIPAIAEQLAFARPDTYGCNLPPWMAAKYPNLSLLKKHRQPRVNGTTSVKKLVSSGGQVFLHFSKSKSFGKDLYANLVAPGLETSLYVECWLNGRGNMPYAECDSKFHVNDVWEVHLKDFHWSVHEDHSKWAVSQDKANKWVCLGDTNRQFPQNKRGGGTLCLEDPMLWDAFSAMIDKFCHCDTAENGDKFQCKN